MDPISDIFKDARRPALTADEKAAGRSALATFMTLTPARPKRSLRAAAMRRAAAVTGLVSALLASAAGVSYAAEGTLPGDALYPVKVRVNEELRVALAPTPQKKAEVEAERAERRLSEAELLAQRGTLTEQVRVSLEQDFETHAAKARLPAVIARLDGALAAHRKIVAALAAHEDADDGADDGTAKRADEAKDASADGEKDAEKDVRRDARRGNRAQLVALGVAIDAAADLNATTPVAAKPGREKDAPRGKTASAEARVANRRDVAARAVANARAALAAASGEMDADEVEKAGARLDAADAAIAEGDALAVNGDADAAVEAYARASRTAFESRSLIAARGSLRLRMTFGDAHEEKTEEEKTEIVPLPVPGDGSRWLSGRER